MTMIPLQHSIACIGSLFVFQACLSMVAAGELHWTKSSPLPDPRAGYAAGVLDGKIVIAGGTYWDGRKGHWTKKLFSARTDIFDPSTRTWERIADAPIPFGYAAFAVVQSRLYVMGGYTGNEESRQILVLERQGPNYVWKVFGELPDTRLFGWAKGVGDSIYLLGGVREFEPTDDVGSCCTSKTATTRLMVLDTVKPEQGWRDLTPYPGGKRWAFAAESDGKNIWMFGGIHAENAADTLTRYNDVLRYSIYNDRWEKLPPLPPDVVKTAPLSPLFVKDKLVFMSFAKTVWQLDPRTMNYTKLAPLPEEAMVDSFFWLNHEIIGTGGENKIEGPRRRAEWTFIGTFE